MLRWLAVAALGAAFLATLAWGQRRGGGFAGHPGFTSHAGLSARSGFAGHAGFAPRASMGFHSPSLRGRGFGGRGFSHTARPGFRWGRGFGSNFRGDGFRRGPYLVTRRSFRHRFYPGAYPYGGWYGYPYWWSDPGWYGDDSYSQDNDYTDDARAYAQDQQSEIDRLRDQVDRLRQSRDAQDAPASQQANPAEPTPPTELVFRDKHSQSVRNYAIVGQSFWILDGARPQRISLAELDLPATIRANEDRGVEFALPR